MFRIIVVFCLLFIIGSFFGLLVISSMMHGNWENTLVFALAVVVGLTSDAVPISITSQLLKNSIHHPSNSMVMKKQNQSN